MLVEGDIVANFIHTSDVTVLEVEKPALAFPIDVEKDSINALRSTNTEAEPTSCFLSPDGERIAVTFQQGFAEIWDRADLENPLLRLDGHQGRVNSIAYSADGITVATGGNDRTVRIWDAATGKQKGILRGHSSPVHSVDFGPGDRLVSSSDHTARVWDLRPVKPLARQMTGHGARVVSVQFAPDGNRLATASEDGTVRVWDTRSDTEFFVIDKPNQHAQPAFARYSPNGKQLLASYQIRNPIRIFDADTGDAVTTLIADRGVLAAFFTSDSKRVVTVSDERVRTVTETEIDGGHKVQVRIWSDWVKHPGRVSIWETDSGKQLLTLPDAAASDFVPDISPDSR